jgi:hypothetical protein
MILPHEIVVLGDDVEAQALRSALLLWVDACHHYSLAAARRKRGATAAYARLKLHLRSGPLVIALSNGHSPAAQIIPLVYQLRTHLAWEGAFVAVVDNEEEAQLLGAASLVGDLGGVAQFSRVEGHAVISRPLLLIDLFAAVAASGLMLRYGWESLRQLAVVPRLCEAVREAEAKLQGRDAEETISAVGRVLELVRQLDWQSLLYDPHRNWGVVSYLLNEHSQPALTDCTLIIEKVSLLMRRSCIGGCR